MNEPERTGETRGGSAAHPTFHQAFRFWMKLGFISFGGPTGQIAIMHTELVEQKRWISESRFLHALNYCMLLPGPEAQQLATYAGWLLHGVPGGICAGALFVLPSAVLLWMLSWIYVVYGQLPWMAAVFAGLKPAVLAIVLAAVLRIGSRVLKNGVMVFLAVLAFVSISVFKAPFPLIIGVSALLGFLGERAWKSKFSVLKGHGGSKPGTDAMIGDAAVSAHQVKPSRMRALTVVCTGLVLWWLPVLAVGAWLGFDHNLVRQGLFFSQAATVTFGGAYAVLPYVSQQAVEHYGWLSGPQMLDGLGLAETTPGPLIMVLQFVGFVGAWKFHEPLSPLLSATIGAFLTSWTTFLPCFLWVFLGAPYVEGLRDNSRLNAALSAITAAVVGVVLNLAVWLGAHVLFPSGQPVNVFGLVVTLVAFYGIVRHKWSVIAVVLGAGLAGFLLTLF